MNHFVDQYGKKQTINLSSVVVNEKPDCFIKFSNNLTQWSNYLLKVGAASTLTLHFCNIDYNSSNHHYTEAIEIQQNNKIRINNFLINVPILDDIDIEHDIAYESIKLENLKTIRPKKSIKIKRKVKNITKGPISKV